jgi:hypothetical protein
MWHPPSAKLELTSLTSGSHSVGIVCSRAKTTEFVVFGFLYTITLILTQLKHVVKQTLKVSCVTVHIVAYNMNTKIQCYSSCNVQKQSYYRGVYYSLLLSSCISTNYLKNLILYSTVSEQVIYIYIYIYIYNQQTN